MSQRMLALFVRSLIFSLFLSLLISNAAHADMDQSEIGELVSQLASKRFAVRRMAHRKLLELGPAALPSLRRQMDDLSSIEAQNRCKKLLKELEKLDRTRRLENFILAPRTSTAPAGWNRFAEIAGDNGDARKLFVDLVQKEPKLMAMADQDGAVLTKAIEKRIAELNRTRITKTAPETATALFFLSAIDGAKPSDEVCRRIGGLGIYEAFHTEIQLPGRSTPIRKILAKWIKSGKNVQYGLTYAIRYDMPEGLAIAKQVLDGKHTTTLKQTALQAIGKLGTEKQLPWLEALFEDTQSLSIAVRVSNRQIRPQVRDLALAAAVMIAGENPRDFGFTRLRLSSTQETIHTSTIGFPSDAARKAAFKKWADR